MEASSDRNDHSVASHEGSDQMRLPALKEDRGREELLARAQAFVDKVEAELTAALETELLQGQGRPQILRDAARHLCFAGGKRARPRLVFLFGHALGLSESALVDIALASELIHTASLMHDDIIDDGKTRRGRPTVNAQWDNTVAVLAGDLMLTLAFSRLKSHGHAITMEAIELVGTMTRASMLEVEALGRLDLDESYWREVARGKTGALFAWCGWAAAELAGNTDARERFTKCGHHLGIAFQMADDLKDIAGGEPGKSPFADLRNGNPSFVIVEALKESKDFRNIVANAWSHLPISEQSAEALGEAMLQAGAASRTLKALEAEISAALDSLGPYKTKAGTAEVVDWIQAMFFSLCQELESDERIRQQIR
jgi:geranylgeranyl pyrophosphate synthase